MRKNMHILFLLSLCICYGHALRGEQVEQDPKNPIYQKMAEEVVQFHLHVKEKNTKRVTVNKVTTQKVAGTVTRMQFQVFLINGISSMCNAEIWEQPWENIKHISYNCDSIFGKRELSAKDNSRPGQVRDPNNSKYPKLAMLALDSYLNTPGSKHFKKEDVKSIYVQTVMVVINTKIATSLVLEVKTKKSGHFKCEAVVLETPWKSTDTAKVDYMDCHKGQNDKADGKIGLLQRQSGKNQQIGGQEAQDPKDPKYKQLAEESFQKYRDDHVGPLFIEKELRVTRVTTQVVSGVSYAIDFKVFTDVSYTYDCHSDIWDQPWLKNKDITVKCIPEKDINISSHSQIDGGESEQDPNNPKYMKLAEESFEKFPHLLFKVKQILVLKVTTQVVSGVITRLDFKVISTEGELLECFSKILEQPWLQKKDITVNCFSPAESKQALHSGKKKLGQGLQDIAIDDYFKKVDTTGQWIVEQKRLSSSKTIKTRFGRNNISYFKVDVLVSTSPYGEYNIFNCSVVFGPTSVPVPIGVNCLKQTRLMGGSQWVDPADELLLPFAEKALQKYSDQPNNYLGAKGKYDIIITFATKGVVVGFRYEIDFIVRSVGVHRVPDLNCHAIIIQDLTNTLDVDKVNCNEKTKRHNKE